MVDLYESPNKLYEELNNLQIMFENAYYDNTLESILESTALAVAESKPKSKDDSKLKKWILAILDKLIQIGNHIRTYIGNLIKKYGKDYIITSDITVSKCIFSKIPSTLLFNLWREESIYDRFTNKDLDAASKPMVLKKGTKFRLDKVLQTQNDLDNLLKKIKTLESGGVKRKIDMVIEFVQTAQKQCDDIIKNSEPINKEKSDSAKSNDDSNVKKPKYKAGKQYTDKDGNIVIDLELQDECACVLLESADLIKNNYCDNVDLLLEATNEINDISKSIKNMDKDDPNIGTKIKNAADKVCKWMYKIEPEKQYGALHTVLSICDILLKFTLLILNAYTMYFAASYAIDSTAEAVINVRNLGKRIPEIKSAKNIAGYASKLMKNYHVGTLAILTIVSTVILKTINNISISSKYKYNMKDYTKNREKLKSQLNKINDAIKSNKNDEDLIKLRDQYKKAITALDTQKIYFETNKKVLNKMEKKYGMMESVIDQ